ncbi:50S ribosomal protein L19 [Candidatus Saccharibacteria bacterium]|nr:50S ribosomal protein L19 [Candidatus Saccharibacteria bacterium]
MSFSILKEIGDAQKKKAVVDVRSGDTVKVTQKIKEGNKFRLQTFEGVVIRVDRKNSHTERIVVRKVTSGVGVEKSYLVHSPLVEKIEITKRSKVRRNNLSYLRQRSGKSARLAGKDFDRTAVNDVNVPEEETPEKAPEEVKTEATDEKKEEAPVEEKPVDEKPVETAEEAKEEPKEEKEEPKA